MTINKFIAITVLHLNSLKLYNLHWHFLALVPISVKLCVLRLS